MRKCPKCHSDDITFLSGAQHRKGFLYALWYYLVLAFVSFLWLMLFSFIVFKIFGENGVSDFLVIASLFAIPCIISIFRKKKTYALCLVCNNKWRVKSNPIKHKKKLINYHTQQNKNLSSDNTSSDKEQIVENPKSLLYPVKLYDECNKYLLKYCYVETLCSCSNLDQIKPKDDLHFMPDISDENDNKAMDVFFGDNIKIGTMPKGTCRNTLWKCYKHNTFGVVAFVKDIDVDNNTVSIIIGFYDQIENFEFITSEIVKTNEKDISDRNRLEHLKLLQVGDEIVMSYDSNADTITLFDDYLFEVGELLESAKKDVLNTITDFKNTYSEVSSLETLEDGNIKAEVRIYLNA